MPILAIVQTFGSGLWSFLSSRFGQICLAFVVAWFWSASNTNSKWEQAVARERAAREAAYQREIARQAQVARDIMDASDIRAQADEALAKDLQAQIDDLKKAEQTHGPTVTREKVVNRCDVDDDLARRMQQLDATARKAAPARPARKVR
jgi:hypothetical protein